MHSESRIIERLIVVSLDEYPKEDIQQTDEGESTESVLSVGSEDFSKGGCPHSFIPVRCILVEYAQVSWVTNKVERGKYMDLQVHVKSQKLIYIHIFDINLS